MSTPIARARARLLVPLLAAPAAALPVARHGAQAGHADRFHTSRASELVLPLPDEDDAFSFAVFGDRTGGPPEGVAVLAEAVDEVNLLGPDLVMTVGDLIEGYNETPEWLEQMREYRATMEALDCPWFPVAGNHDVYWRGPDGERPAGEHEASYEAWFGPLWYAFRHKTAWFVVLYSDEGDPATGRKAFGDPTAQRMSPEQLAWLEATLRRAREAEHVFVFLHHPRWIGGGYGDDWERVHALLAGARNVRAVFAGHIHHMRYDGPRDGIEYFTLATVGGHQGGHAPRAGYLHQYLVVSVRPERLAVASLPVGSAFDPRAITAEVGDDAARLALELAPAWAERIPFDPGAALDRGLAYELANPTSRPIEVTAVASARDGRWSLLPDHQHVRIAPGGTARLALRIARAAPPGGDGLDAGLVAPELALRVDYLAERARFALPERRFELPLAPHGLAAPAARTGAAGERVLALDGVGGSLRVDHRDLELPQGPLTVEGWLRADELRERQAFVAKTEASEFALFVSGGVPELLVHLDGRYAVARAAEPLLVPGAWHHLAGVFDGAELRLYVDGERVATRAASGERTVRALPLLVGADVTADGEGTSFFPGAVDEVRISRVARYAGARFEPQRRFEPDADTALLLHMDAELGPWVFDGSPAGAHPRRLGGAHVEALRAGAGSAE